MPDLTLRGHSLARFTAEMLLASDEPETVVTLTFWALVVGVVVGTGLGWVISTVAR